MTSALTGLPSNDNADFLLTETLDAMEVMGIGGECRQGGAEI